MQSKIFLSSLLCSGIVASFAFADVSADGTNGAGSANASAQASQTGVQNSTLNSADGGGAFN